MLHGAVLTVLHQQGDEEVHELDSVIDVFLFLAIVFVY